MKKLDHNDGSLGTTMDARVRTIVRQTIKEHILDKPDEVDKEKCLADAAEKIVEALRAEAIFSSDKDGTTGKGISGSRRKFDEIVGHILEDVRFGYLSSNLQMLMALGSTIAERDTGSAEHNYKVTLYSAMLGEEIGREQKQIQSLVKGSFLHDIGKIGIPDRILLKTSKLSSFESITMRNHVLVGAHIIKDVKWLEDAQEVVLFHHEKWDGSGYLSGLKGEKIPINARIFTIVDVFDALTSDRPYKPAMSFDQAIRYLKRQTNIHFDPEIMNCFIKISEELLCEIAAKDLSELPGMVEGMINRHFNIDLSDDKLKTKYRIL